MEYANTAVALMIYSGHQNGVEHMPELQPQRPRSITVRADQPLVGVIVQEDGTEMVRYTMGEPASDRQARRQSIQRALNLAGAWSDLDFDEMLDELDRIRHESQPTPPVDLTL